MSNLNDITLRSELVCWLFKNGRKSRNYKNQRFGQYIWNKYKWSNQKSNKDGFYDESPASAYLKIKNKIA